MGELGDRLKEVLVQLEADLAAQEVAELAEISRSATDQAALLELARTSPPPDSWFDEERTDDPRIEERGSWVDSSTVKRRKEPAMPQHPIATVRPVEEAAATGRVAAVFADIKATKQIDFVPKFWRVLATNADHLELVWSRLKALMHPEAAGRAGPAGPADPRDHRPGRVGDQRLCLLHQLAYGGRGQAGTPRRSAGRGAGDRRPVQFDQRDRRWLPDSARRSASPGLRRNPEINGDGPRGSFPEGRWAVLRPWP